MTGALDLPPAYRAIVLREHRDALGHACAVAAEEGAGTLVWVRRFDSVEVAVVLEPAEPLATARRALYAVMNAAGDALATHCPPERPLSFAWPDTILFDRGIVGGARLAWPAGAAEREPPAWLAAGLLVRLSVPHIRPAGPQAHPLDVALVRGTSLEIEGFEMMDAAALIASFARHLMLQIDLWQERGFAPVGRQFLARLPEQRGWRRSIETNGDLLLRRLGKAGAAQRRALTHALREPQWLDPETGAPWL